jgi:hypothetical protein
MYNNVVKNIIKRRSIEKYRRSIKKKVRSVKKKVRSVKKKVRSVKKKVRSVKKKVVSKKKRSMKKVVSSMKKVVSNKKRTVKKRSVKKVTFKNPIDDYDEECNKITAKLSYLKISDKCSGNNIINFEHLNNIFGADKIDKCYRKPTFKIDCSKITL